MNDVFICHSEKDGDRALDLAARLEEAGLRTWYYERDNVPGESYLIQVGRAIDAARCVIFLVSRDSLGSNQVVSEVVRAYETRIPIIPLLLGVTHREIQEQPVLRQALVTSTSLPIPRGRVDEILPRVIRGLENLGIRPSSAEVATPVSAQAGPGPGDRETRARNRVLLLLAGVLAVLGAVILGVKWTGLDRRSPNPAGTVAPSMTVLSDSIVASPIPPPVRTQQPPASDEISSPASESDRIAEAPAANAAPVIIVALTADSTGIAEKMLASALRSRGHPACALEEAVGHEPAVRLRAGLPHDAFTQGGEPALRTLRIAARIVGTVRTTDVGQAYGFYSVRAEIEARLVDEKTGGMLGEWTGSTKSSMPARDAARDAALRGAAEGLARRIDEALR